MPDFYFLFTSAVCQLFFGRVRLVGEPLPDSERPALYVGVTRNGLLDEWIFSYASCSFARRPTRFWPPLVTKGKKITRRVRPDFKFSNIVENLMRGSAFFVFATDADLEDGNAKSLIDRAARIAKSVGRKRADLEVVPVAFFYDSWGADAVWGSDVDVFIGESMGLSASASEPRFMETGFTEQKFEDIDTAKLGARIKETLQDMDSRQPFSRLSLYTARQLAHLATTDGRASYALSLSVTTQLPEHSPLVGTWEVFRKRCEELGVKMVNGFPVFATERLTPLIAETVLSAVPAWANFFLNIPVFILVGAFLFFMKDEDTDRRRRKRSTAFAVTTAPWTILLWAQFFMAGMPWLILPHALITLSGGYCTKLFRVGCAQIMNSVRHPELRGMYGRLREELLSVIYREDNEDGA
ncbi:hypothetical protein FACS1894187_22000 [Synergistales bacterium]|nr:hypothetical protein FACS1894187_22000 [Synergistales bacterium]